MMHMSQAHVLAVIIALYGDLQYNTLHLLLMLLIEIEIMIFQFYMQIT